MARRSSSVSGGRRTAAAESVASSAVGDGAVECGRESACARSARGGIGRQLAQLAGVVSVVRSAAPYAGLCCRRSDRAASDCARSESARRTSAARTDLPRSARASENRRPARTDHLGPSESGGCRRPDERHIPQRVLRSGNGVRRASAVRQGDRAPHAGARLVADSAAGRYPARAIAAGSREKRRRRQDAAGGGDQVPQRARR